MTWKLKNQHSQLALLTNNANKINKIPIKSSELAKLVWSCTLNAHLRQFLAATNSQQHILKQILYSTGLFLYCIYDYNVIVNITE